MPAESQAQYRYMQGIAHGMKPRGGGGPSPAQAKEFVEGQSPRGLPERKSKGGGDMGYGGGDGRFIQVHRGTEGRAVLRPMHAGTMKHSKDIGGGGGDAEHAAHEVTPKAMSTAPDGKYDRVGAGRGKA